MIGRANDRFLVLDDEQRVAFVAQVVHHAHEPADVARMQTDARLVHDEKRVHERRAETGREVHALHFAAAQCAGGAIEREIAEADFAQDNAAARTISSRNIAAVESLGGRVRSGEKVPRAGNRKARELRQRAALIRLIRPVDAETIW